jgi:hypothetical protein
LQKRFIFIILSSNPNGGGIDAREVAARNRKTIKEIRKGKERTKKAARIWIEAGLLIKIPPSFFISI